MRFLASAAVLCFIGTCLPAAAKTCTGDATALSIKLLPKHSLRGGQSASATAPNGCVMVCTGGSEKKGTKRSCHWQ